MEQVLRLPQASPDHLDPTVAWEFGEYKIPLIFSQVSTPALLGGNNIVWMQFVQLLPMSTCNVHHGTDTDADID